MIVCKKTNVAQGRPLFGDNSGVAQVGIFDLVARPEFNSWLVEDNLCKKKVVAQDRPLCIASDNSGVFDLVARPVFNSWHGLCQSPASWSDNVAGKNKRRQIM